MKKARSTMQLMQKNDEADVTKYATQLMVDDVEYQRMLKACGPSQGDLEKKLLGYRSLIGSEVCMNTRTHSQWLWMLKCHTHTQKVFSACDIS